MTGNLIKGEQRPIYRKHFLAMHLVWQNEPVLLYAQFAA